MKYAWLVALFLVASIALVNPFAEAGMNDDWSFIRTALDLARSGHLKYNGWSAPLIGFQAYWAALFIKIFGFSFFTARASIWLLALFFIPIFWQLLRLIEVGPAQSFIGMTSFLLSPLVLPNLTTFMTDMPAFFFYAAALLSALKAWKSEDHKLGMLWLAAITLCTLISGSIRQIYWLAGILVLLTLALLHFRSARARVISTSCIVLIIMFGGSASTWLTHQPYVPEDRTLSELHQIGWQHSFNIATFDFLRAVLLLAILCVPLTLPLAINAARGFSTALTLMLSLAPFFVFVIPIPNASPDLLLGNTITDYGVIFEGTVTVGLKPVIVPVHGLWWLAFVAIECAVLSLIATSSIHVQNSALKRFAILTLPFLLIYTAVLLFRAPAFGEYDRYLIPHLFVLICFALALNQQRTISPVTLISGLVFMLYAIATTHDYFSEARAKVEATQKVLEKGNLRTAVISGFEIDSWAQVERTGYINNGLIATPANAYHEAEDCNGADEVLAWWRPFAPSLKARYIVASSRLPDMQPLQFAPVEYRRWLPYRTFQLYVESIPTDAPPLTCH